MSDGRTIRVRSDVPRGAPENRLAIRPHDLLQRPRPVLEIGVHDQARHAVALQGEGTEAGVLDELLEDLVAQLHERLLAVHGLAQAEQAGHGGQRPEERGDGGRATRTVATEQVMTASPTGNASTHHRSPARLI